jgi:hypothetical protein
MKLSTLVLLVASTTCASGIAQAAVISFSSLSQPGTELRQLGNTVSQDGFTFASSGGSFGNILSVWQAGSANLPVGGVASTSLMEYYAESTTTMTATDGSAFQLNGIDLASWAVGQIGTMTVTFDGTRTDGSLVSQSFDVINSGNSTPELQRFEFGASFTNLSSVRFKQGRNSFSTAFQFNNLSVSTVPEPGSLALLALAAGGAALALRRRSSPPTRAAL